MSNSTSQSPNLFSLYSDGGGETDEEGGAGESLLGVPGSDLDLKLSPAMTPETGSLKGDSPRAEGGSIASAGGTCNFSFVIVPFFTRVYNMVVWK